MLRATEVDPVLRTVAGGKLEATDYDNFKPLFEHIATQKTGRVPMLIELAPDFSGRDFGDLWRDIKFDARRTEQFGRIAILGEKKWEEWGTKLSDPLFPSADMRFFVLDQLSDAESWVRGERKAKS